MNSIAKTCLTIFLLGLFAALFFEVGYQYLGGFFAISSMATFVVAPLVKEMFE